MGMNINAYTIADDLRLAEVDAREMSDVWFTDDVVRWVDVSASSSDDVQKIIEQLRLPSAIGEAIMSTNTQSRVIAFETLLFGAIPIQPSDCQSTCLRFLCGPTGLLTLHTAPVLEIDEVAKDLQDDLRLTQATVAALLFQILEAVQRGMVTVVVALRSDLYLASEKLKAGSREISTDDLLALKQRAIGISDTIEDQLYCVRELYAARSESLQLSKTRAQFRKLLATLEGSRANVLRLEDRIGDLRQSFTNQLQEVTNRRLNVVAVLSTIYLPATLIAGIYGMNFTNIPIVQMPYGYLLVMLLMAALVVGQILFFWRRGWFK